MIIIRILIKKFSPSIFNFIFQTIVSHDNETNLLLLNPILVHTILQFHKHINQKPTADDMHTYIISRFYVYIIIIIFLFFYFLTNTSHETCKTPYRIKVEAWNSNEPTPFLRMLNWKFYAYQCENRQILLCGKYVGWWGSWV